ncbi:MULTISPECIES: nucleotide exchange factor GrpE [unclassified Nocardioides]|uniref:nucleotide exchange factor GrpE n=1 Tax=unclassified Nocardioides TaxID=2615069 RepID=UPI000700C546|nr:MULTISPECIES: nucleotide exchange factor GrpE [unclassified Nocardioides]KQY57059.1 molecular chaperone GrpE [Nocardioides sp. Root140]KRF11699.1 molecular chaperone GrpE [Nocardioides sp. Soil796]
MTQGPGDESPEDPAAEERSEQSAAPEEQPIAGHSFGEAAAEMANESEVEEPQQSGERPDPADDELAVARMELEERTLDLQRLQAEFLNYKRRVDRDRELIKENATFSALAPITEVLDNIDRARAHGPLDEGFRAVADQLERVVAGQGLVRYGAPGEAFDPSLHDALSHMGEDAEVEVTTVKVVAKAGYKIGDRVVRAAQVLVVDPASDATDS